MTADGGTDRSQADGAVEEASGGGDEAPTPVPAPGESLEPAVRPVGVASTGGDREAEPGSRSGRDDGAGIDPEEIDVTSLTGPVRSLDPRVRLVWIAQSLLSAVVFGAVVSVGAAFLFNRPWLGGAVTALLATAGSAHALLRYRSWRYEVRADSLYLERGVFTRVSTVVPYVRIQHVDASRGPIERLVGLATTVVYTAGSRGADVSIPGLTPGDAEGLQRRLKRLAIAAEGDDAV